MTRENSYLAIIMFAENIFCCCCKCPTSSSMSNSKCCLFIALICHFKKVKIHNVIWFFTTQKVGVGKNLLCYFCCAGHYCALLKTDEVRSSICDTIEGLYSGFCGGLACLLAVWCAWWHHLHSLYTMTKNQKWSRSSNTSTYKS